MRKYFIFIRNIYRFLVFSLISYEIIFEGSFVALDGRRRTAFTAADAPAKTVFSFGVSRRAKRKKSGEALSKA